MIKPLILLLCTFGVLSAVDLTGTWKLDTAKSKYEGIPAPKEETVTITANGKGFDMAVGTSPTGQSVRSTVKEGEQIVLWIPSSITNWDDLVIKRVNRNKAEAELNRGGKSVGEATRVLDQDGRVYTVSGKVKLSDGKTARFKAVYTKQ